jgi:hypothetical protein
MLAFIASELSAALANTTSTTVFGAVLAVLAVFASIAGIAPCAGGHLDTDDSNGHRDQ